MTRADEKISRRELLRSLLRPGLLAGPCPPLRPPYAAAPELFRLRCPTCADQPCLGACPPRIIHLGADGTPRLDLALAGCTLCQECALACDRGVLDPGAAARIRAVLILARSDCLAWRRTLCTFCGDICPVDAIDSIAGREPTVGREACTGCGLCIHVCPTQAIRLLAEGADRDAGRGAE